MKLRAIHTHKRKQRQKKKNATQKPSPIGYLTLIPQHLRHRFAGIKYCSLELIKCNVLRRENGRNSQDDSEKIVIINAKRQKLLFTLISSLFSSQRLLFSSFVFELLFDNVVPTRPHFLISWFLLFFRLWVLSKPSKTSGNSCSFASNDRNQDLP